MASDPVHPLRIHKPNLSTSPSKMSGVSRPLSEISPMEKRRNSPSWFQGSTSPTKKSTHNTDSSPFQSSPMESTASPRLFWQNRNTENMVYGTTRSGSPSPTRRSSIERLQRASRVKNSNILALEQKQEYDPTRIPKIERPLAKVQSNVFGAFNSSPLSMQDDLSDDGSNTPSALEIDTTPDTIIPTYTKIRDDASPIKSALSPTKFKSSFDQESGIWSADTSFDERQLPSGRVLHRHAKSVTFDAAPPQINEYEMATPDISSIGTGSREGSYESFDDEEEDSVLYESARSELHEDSFDASLEDTDKTPVVGPEDWRGDSPMVHVRQLEDWEGSPMPENPPQYGRPVTKRTDSSNSNGDSRPLPPLPGMSNVREDVSGSTPTSPGLSATAERMLGSHRSLPSPPPASFSKSDIQNIGNGKMTLEERLKLMMLSDDGHGKTPAEQQRERRLRRGNGRERFGSPSSEPESTTSGLEADEADDTIGDISGLDDYQLPSRVSRESIMARVNGNQALERDSEYHFSSPAPSSSPQRSPERQMSLDPDIPIPSTEDSQLDDIEEELEDSVIINRDAARYIEDDEHSDVFYQRSDLAVSRDEIRIHEDDDSESHYSDSNEPMSAGTGIARTEEETTTPRAQTPVQESSVELTTSALTTSLPDLGPKYAAFSQDFESYMIPRSEHSEERAVDEAPIATEVKEELPRPRTPERRSMSKPEYDGTGWGEPDEYGNEPSTPESVIHHPMSDDEEQLEQTQSVEEPIEAPVVPERVATIKASGSKLKTRVSGTPSDLAAMREARRQVSVEAPEIPPIPERHRNRMSRDLTADVAGDDFLERHPSFKNRSLTLDLDLGLSLDQDFERVIETQKRGYLMRQNTKLVTASDKDGDDPWKTKSAGNSPVKANARPQSWTVEPWNSKTRRSSVRKGSGATGPRGPVPPMPGQQSNATALTQVVEEDISAEIASPDSGERGRLFVKVMGVKDLDLPIPKNERTWFSLTLDNGVHCVTTAWLELARKAPIGQEFELVVPNDLEFQLTLNVKLDKPAPIKLNASAIKPTKPKPSTFSRVFASPKKRKEMELRQREEEERAQRDAQAAQQRRAPTSAYDMLSPLAADDGSFARSYVCLKEHESRCFGRPYMAEIACFNEWATEEAGFASSVKSKRGNTAVVRRAPYKIGKLEVQMLFVPRPKNSADEDMPKSMNSSIRELKAAEERLSRNWEGHLSQQGGDCPYWRRRYFKLVGTKLTAYHEATRQPRATINLANAKRLIDDRRALTEKETLGKGGKRRRSAFAEEEDGYMFVEEGFRIRFNNGELIDFYADTADDKEGWMKILSDVFGRGESNVDEDASGTRTRAKWCELVLKREEQARKRTDGRRVHSRTKSMYT